MGGPFSETSRSGKTGGFAGFPVAVLIPGTEETMNEIQKDDEIIQIQGPCRNQVFIVDEVDGSLLHVRLKNPRPPYNSHLEWSHKDNFIKRT